MFCQTPEAPRLSQAPMCRGGGEESVGGGGALPPPHEDGLPGEVAGHAAATDHAGAVQRPPEEAQTGPGEQRPVEIEHRQPALMVREPRGSFRRTGGGDVVSIDVDPGAHEPMMRVGAVRFVNTVGGAG